VIIYLQRIFISVGTLIAGGSKVIEWEWDGPFYRNIPFLKFLLNRKNTLEKK
jgi:uncharacterized membrane protein YkgB